MTTEKKIDTRDILPLLLAIEARYPGAVRGCGWEITDSFVNAYRCKRAFPDHEGESYPLRVIGNRFIEAMGSATQFDFFTATTLERGPTASIRLEVEDGAFIDTTLDIGFYDFSLPRARTRWLRDGLAWTSALQAPLVLAVRNLLDAVNRSDSYDQTGCFIQLHEFSGVMEHPWTLFVDSENGYVDLDHFLERVTSIKNLYSLSFSLFQRSNAMKLMKVNATLKQVTVSETLPALQLIDG